MINRNKIPHCSTRIFTFLNQFQCVIMSAVWPLYINIIIKDKIRLIVVPGTFWIMPFKTTSFTSFINPRLRVILCAIKSRKPTIDKLYNTFRVVTLRFRIVKCVFTPLIKTALLKLETCLLNLDLEWNFQEITSMLNDTPKNIYNGRPENIK